MQPTQYSKEEIKKLKEFVKIVQSNDSRAALACWGDHDNYSHGY